MGLCRSRSLSSPPLRARNRSTAPRFLPFAPRAHSNPCRRLSAGHTSNYGLSFCIISRSTTSEGKPHAGSGYAAAGAASACLFARPLLEIPRMNISAGPTTSRVTPLIVIVGPTASGKSALGVHLAERLRGEVVACDSTQVYRHFDIGTAKPTWEEQRGIPHHLMDLVEPQELFTAGEYRLRALEILEVLRQRNSLPIVTAGTGLYLRALLEGLADAPTRSEELRTRLIERRGEAMLARGWLQEVRDLVAREIPATAKPFQFIGYSELRAHLEGKQSLKEAVAAIQQATRRYAKRQLTWFRKESGVHWFPGFGDDTEIVAAVHRYLEKGLVGESPARACGAEGG